MRRITKAMTLLEKRASGNELPEAEAGHPVRAASIQLRRDIVSRLADLFELLDERQRQLVLGSGNMKRPLPEYQRLYVLGSVQLLGQGEGGRLLAQGRPTRPTPSATGQPLCRRQGLSGTAWGKALPPVMCAIISARSLRGRRLRLISVTSSGRSKAPRIPAGR
jgi:hypothetical protein